MTSSIHTSRVASPGQRVASLCRTGKVMPCKEASLLSLEQTGAAVLSSECSQPPYGLPYATRWWVNFTSSWFQFTEVLKWGKRSQTTAHCWVFSLNKDTPRVEFHIRCRQTANSNFCSHDSTVSALFISPSFICALLLLCCSEALQGTVAGWWHTWVEDQTRQRIERTARERTELKERSQICSLDKLFPT